MTKAFYRRLPARGATPSALLLFTALLFVVHVSRAASVNDVSNGNYNVASTWTPAISPGGITPGDFVTIDSHPVTISSPNDASNDVIYIVSPGVLTCGSGLNNAFHGAQINLAGRIDYDNGGFATAQGCFISVVGQSTINHFNGPGSPSQLTTFGSLNFPSNGVILCVTNMQSDDLAQTITFTNVSISANVGLEITDSNFSLTGSIVRIDNVLMTAGSMLTKSGPNPLEVQKVNTPGFWGTLVANQGPVVFTMPVSNRFSQVRVMGPAKIDMQTGSSIHTDYLQITNVWMTSGTYPAASLGPNITGSGTIIVNLSGPPPPPPQTANNPASGITSNSATLNGMMVNNGGFGTETYIYWGTNDGGVVHGAWQTNTYVGTIWSVGPFSTNVTGLLPNTMYYYRCWASNVNGSAWAPNTANFDTMPSGGGTPYFKLSGIPQPAFTGMPLTVTVEAWDGTNIWTGYTGTVHFTSSHNAASVPGDYTFLPGDFGVKTFNNGIVFTNCGDRLDISVNDTVDMYMWGEMRGLAVFSGYGTAASRFAIWGYEDPVFTGKWSTVSIAAVDQNFAMVTNFTGIVNFTSSDGAASLPLGGSGSFSLAPADNGWHTFSNDLVFWTVGEHWLKVQSVLQTGVWEKVWNITVRGEGTGTNVDHFVIDVPHMTDTNSWLNFFVEARDQFENVFTGFVGNVVFDSSDPAASYPPFYNFLPGDKGSREFFGQLRFGTIGTHWLNARWSIDTNVTGTAYDIEVMAPFVNGPMLQVELPRLVMAGAPFSIVVRAVKDNGQPDTNYLGTVQYTTTDPGATTPGPFTFTPGNMGVAVISGFTFNNGGWREIMVEDQSDQSINGDAETDVLVGGATSTTHFRVDVLPRVCLYSISNDVAVMAMGDGNRIDTSFSGNVQFSSSDAIASFLFTSNAPFVNGIALISNQVKFMSMGEHTLRAELAADTNVCGETRIWVTGSNNRYFVDSLSGADVNDGLSPATAWRTIGRSGSSIGIGDTVIVAPGKYTESVVPPVSGGVNQYVTYYADQDGKFFTGKRGHVNVDSGNMPAFDITTRSYIAVCGFDATSHSMYSGGTGIVANGANYCRFYGNAIFNKSVGISLDGSSDVVLWGNFIESCTNCGVQIVNTADNLLMTENEIQECGRGVDFFSFSSNVELSGNMISGATNGGFWAEGAISKFERNAIYSNAPYGVMVQSGSSTINMKHNIVFDNIGDGVSFMSAATGSAVINNTIVNNSTGINLNNTDGSVIRNNIVAFNTTAGIMADSTSVLSWSNSYNCVYGSPANYSGFAFAGTGDISLDPLFAMGEPVEFDFHLQSQAGRLTCNGLTIDAATSPCIDAGDPTDTFGNEPMPNGGRVNMGAYGNTYEASRSLGMDADGDGMPDPWEILHFGGTNVLPNLDADSDGLVNIAEFIAGTDPTNAFSVLGISSVSVTNGNPAFTWLSVTNRSYFIDRSTDLAGWFGIATNIPGSDPESFYEDTSAPTMTSVYYRVGTQIGTNAVYSMDMAALHYIDLSTGVGGYATGVSGWYINGSNVSFTAVATNGYSFAGWTGSYVTNANPLAFAVTQAVTAMANFMMVSNDITASAGAGGSIAPSGTVWVTYGNSQPYTITPDPNWHVIDVVVDGSLLGPTNDFTFFNVTNGGHTIVASFAIDSNDLVVASTFGVPTPGAGVTWFGFGATAFCAVAGSPVTAGSTQYVCKGSVGTGSAPGFAPGTNVSFAMTSPSTLTWEWDTNHWIQINTGPNGSVDIPSLWLNTMSNVTVTATPTNGYSFAGWTGNTNGCSVFGDQIMIFGGMPRTIQANFSLNTYPINTFAGPNGSVSPSGTVMVAHGSNQVFSIVPDPNYHVLDVMVDATPIGPTNSFTFVNVTNPHSIDASFEIDKFPLTIASAYGFPTPPVGVSSQDWNFPIFASVGSPEPDGAGTQRVCVGWSGTGSAPASGTSNSVNFNITNATTLTWNWATEVWLDVFNGGGGSVNVGGGWYPLASNLVITATPTNGYSFAGWTGDVPPANTNDNPLTLIMSQTRVITANFTPDSYDITASAGTGGSVNPTGTVYVGFGGSQPYSISPDPNWHIVDVLVDAVPQGAIANYTFMNVTNGGHTISAIFAADSNALVVTSAFGTPTPDGTNWYAFGTTASCSIAGSPILNGGTQTVCIGWIGTGSVPASGAGTTTGPFAITTPSTIDWQWDTQYMLTSAAGPNGNVIASNGWYASGSMAMLDATPNGGYHFAGWTGAVPAANTNDNPLWLTMDQARSVTANFAVDVGSINVTINPAGAIAAGAQWRMTTGPDTTWHNSGDAVPNVPGAGSPYTVAFRPIAGWTVPQNLTNVVVVDGSLTSRSGTYMSGTMALVSGGTFMMGNIGGVGGHQVTLSSFYMDTKEVTVAEFAAFCAATANPMPPAPPWGWANSNLPIVNVSWNEASAYASWAGKRLPTEAEFEYAMRSGAPSQTYPWGNAEGTGNANYNVIVGQPSVAGSYPVSAYGLYDIGGNVWEWCGDWYADLLFGPVTDPQGAGGGSLKIIRSGSWVSFASRLQCANRFAIQPFARYTDLGFRCAADVIIGGAGTPTSGDVNGNGIPDWWEQWYFGVQMGKVFDGNLDSDADGLSNAAEYKAGTDPTNAASVLSIEHTEVSASGNGFVVKWQSAPGKSYTIERSSDLTKGFTPVATRITSTPPENTYTDSNIDGVGPFFYRIKVE